MQWCVELTLHISYKGCIRAWMCDRIRLVVVAEDSSNTVFHTLCILVKKTNKKTYDLNSFQTCYSLSLNDGIHAGYYKIFEHISDSKFAKQLKVRCNEDTV